MKLIPEGTYEWTYSDGRRLTFKGQEMIDAMVDLLNSLQEGSGVIDGATVGEVFDQLGLIDDDVLDRIQFNRRLAGMAPDASGPPLR